ncbi:MAG: PorT family protein [Bacteroidales bacterium]|jgi:hypothetical protein|nr:PorT family protein [Bacteroidales bacterium]
MKKILIFAIAVAFSATTFAQQTGAFNAGVNSSRFAGDDVVFSSFKLGYQVGFTSEVGGVFSFEPGIFLINKGNGAGNGTNLNYIQVPINLKISVGVSNLRIVGGFGAYGSLGLWANQNKSKIKFYDLKNEATLKPYDLGGQVFAGIQLNRLSVKVGYQPGLTALYKNKKMYNNSVSLNLTFRLSDPELEKYSK